jgi:hypothetical protein
MSVLDDVRTAIATALADVTGLIPYERWPESCEAELPAAAPVMAREEYHLDFSGDSTLAIDIVVLAARASVGFEAGQAALDPYLDKTGPYSIKAALEADGTLGGKVQGLTVKYWDDYRYDWKLAPASPECWGARIRAEVYL